MGERVVVAFQGEPGAYSEQAALELLGSSVATVGLESFEKCFRAVEDGEATFAMLPIENSLGGTIHANYDLQLRYGFFIVAEHDFRVRHCLLKLPSVALGDVSKVLSHPQALAQCDGYLRGKNLVGESSYDTAGSAKMIAENPSLKTCAAIASSLAAEHYGLEIVERGIEDDDNNFTRFLLLSKRWLPLPALKSPVQWKTTMVFSLINYPGVLVKALSAFSFRDVSLTKLESRPDKLRLKGRNLIVAGSAEDQQIPHADQELLDKLNNFFEMDDVEALHGSNADAGEQEQQRFQFVFYVEFVGSLADAKVRNALRHLSELATFLRVLGCYPQKGVLCDYVSQAVGGREQNDAALRSVPSTSGTATGSALATPSKLKIGIIGFGNFGQFIAKTFAKHHDVFACSRSDYSAQAAAMGVGYSADISAMMAQSQGLDVLVISVSILSFEAVVRRLPSNLLENLLVVDVLSVKMLPKNVLQVLLPPSADILCTHPMFGPESGKYSWRGLPFVYEKVRVSNAETDLRCERFVDIFRQEGCRMVDMSCEIHDEAAAGSQFVTHFTGRMLNQLGMRSTPINTKGFETLLTLVDNTCKDSFDLFLALYKCNPNASSELAAMQRAMNSITAQLNQGSEEQPALVEGANISFSEFVGRIKPSGTSATHAKALELKRQGRDIITTLTVGEPDFAPPQPVLDAVARAASEGMTRYTTVGGLYDLKQAISDDYAKRKSVEYVAGSDILITHGGKQAIFLAVLSLCHPADEVVIPAPYWTSYPDIVALSGAKPVVVQRNPANGYIMTAEELEKALTPKTRMLILCNPCNPTGATYSREELEALARVLEQPRYAHVWVLSDEIYERLTFDGLEHMSFASLPGMKHRTLLVNGFAKGFAMTGFRLGWLGCSNSSVISACTKLQSQLNSCASSISQYAGVAALREVSSDMLTPLYEELERKRDKIVALLGAIPNVLCPVPRGAFYVFPDVSFYLLKGLKSKKTGAVVNTTTELCTYLIEEHGLALPPGDAFGAGFGVRFSYATTFQDIESAVSRFRDGLLGLE